MAKERGGSRANSGRPKGRHKKMISFSLDSSYVEMIKSNPLLKKRVLNQINLTCNEYNQ